jgi:DNA-binding CsgD family transcriptional regulator
MTILKFKALHFLKPLLFVSLYFCTTSSLFSQPIEENIQRLLESSDNYHFKDNLKSLKYAKEATDLAEKANNELLLAKSYLILGRSLNSVGASSLSLEYLDKGFQLSSVQNSVILKTVYKEFKGDNYNRLGLHKQELKEFLEILDLIPKDDNRETQQIFSRIHARIAHSYYQQKNYNSALKHIDIALKIQEKLSETERTSELYNVYLVKGEICLQVNKADSAYYYFKKASDLIRKGEEFEYLSLKSFGDYYNKIGNNMNAIHYYEEALKDMEKFNVVEDPAKLEILKDLAEIHRIEGNNSDYLKHLENYIKIENGLRQKEKENVQAAIDIIVKDQKSKENGHSIYLWIIISIISLLLIYLFIVYRKTHYKKRKILFEKNTIERKSKENIEILEKKLQVSVDELIEDAKNNQSSFLEKFQLVYPDFYNKLIKLYPNLNSGELELLAYIYLNFSTKDIASYTYRSYRTIQSRKYSLRKKLGLESHEDFYIWLRNL